MFVSMPQTRPRKTLLQEMTASRTRCQSGPPIRTIVLDLLPCTLMPDANPQTKPDARRGRSRAALLASLGQVFETMGYDGASLTQLAAATGLGKASLYHHFPGGKAEMAAVLLRDAVAELERSAFARLGDKGSPDARLAAFIDGFREYVQDGERICLITVFGQGSAGEIHGETIASQFSAWQRRVAATFEEAGLKPKRAERAAADLLSNLYGSLLTSRLSGDPSSFKKRAKRLKRSLSV